jgi:integrase/recombinase XerD
MSTDLHELVQDYLRLRRSLGFKITKNEWILGRFIAYLDQKYPGGLVGFTVDDVLTFAALPGGSPSWHGQRLSVVRVFAVWAHYLDPNIPLIPAGLMPSRGNRAVPYLYSDRQVADLMGQAGHLRPRLHAATYQTLLGLLAVTGMRVGEVIALDTSDLNTDAAVMTIRESKFGKSRMVPLHPSTVDAVTNYLDLRRHLQPSPSTSAMLVSGRGTRLFYNNVQHVVARLTRQAGITPRSTRCRPRIHDLRHTFAVATMLDAYRHGADPAARLVQLATYLGHANPTDTYWYLSASPELMAAAGRLADIPIGGRR